MTNKQDLLNALLRFPSAVRMRFRVTWLRLLGARIGARCWMQDVWIPRNPWEIQIDAGSALDRQVVLLTTGAPKMGRKILIGAGSYINRFTMIDASQRIEIGCNCMIGPYCYLTDHDHAHLPGRLIRDQPLRSAPVQIGSDVWLGAGVIVLKGVTIGDNVVVGAGAVVTNDVTAGAKVAGVPARVIGRRELQTK